MALPSTSSSDQLGFPNARIRVGAERFELSFGVAWKRFAAILLFAVWSAAFLLPIVPVAAAAVLLVVVFLVLVERRHLVITRRGSWGVTTLLGVQVSRHALGLHPKVDNLGYDWDELGVYPILPELRRVLHDGERFVLVEWTEQDGPKATDGRHLLEIARAEVLRLHGLPTA